MSRSKDKLHHNKEIETEVDIVKPVFKRISNEIEGISQQSKDSLPLHQRLNMEDQNVASYNVSCSSKICSRVSRNSIFEGSSINGNTELVCDYVIDKAGNAQFETSTIPMVLTAVKYNSINVHLVQHHFPSPVLSYVENLPIGGHVSHINTPKLTSDHSDYSSEGSSKAMQDVHISARLMEEFMELASGNTKKNLETCGILGAFLRNQIFYVTTLIIPKQESTSCSCQALNEEEIHAIQHMQSLLPVGWIHTHPSQTCFLSSIDLHTQYSYQVMLPEAIAIVMAPTDPARTYGIFRLTDPGGITLLKECREGGGFHLHPETCPDGSPIYESCSNVYINPNLRFEVIDLRPAASSP